MDCSKPDVPALHYLPEVVQSQYTLNTYYFPIFILVTPIQGIIISCWDYCNSLLIASVLALFQSICSTSVKDFASHGWWWFFTPILQCFHIPLSKSHFSLKKKTKICMIPSPGGSQSFFFPHFVLDTLTSAMPNTPSTILLQGICAYYYFSFKHSRLKYAPGLFTLFCRFALKC